MPSSADSARGRWRAALPALGLAALLPVLTTCGLRPQPTPVALGEPIAIGGYTLTVTGVRDAWETVVHVPIGEDERGLVLMVDWSGLQALDVMSRRQFMEHFDTARITLRDGDGRSYRAHSSDEAALYVRPGESADLTGSTRDQAVWFVVPRQASGFVAVIENPEPREGQPARVQVPLGR